MNNAKNMIVSILTVLYACAAMQSCAHESVPVSDVKDNALGCHQPRAWVTSSASTSGNGRRVYEELIDSSTKRRGAVPMVFSYEWATKGFDGCGNRVCLDSLVFGASSISLYDIYLPSRLSRNTLVHLDQTGKQPVFDRPPNLPNGATAANFGDYGSDQYIGLLSPAHLDFGLSSAQLGFELAAMWRYPIERCRHTYNIVFGLTFPLRSVMHNIDLRFTGAPLNKQRAVYMGNNVATNREMAIEAFFADFGSQQDFFTQAVLGPKNLCYVPRQRANGLADIVFTALCDITDFGDSWCRGGVDSVQLGMNFIFPTGSRDNGAVLWQPILGNGGAYQFEPYLHMMFYGPNYYINPVLRIAGSLSAPFTNGSLRVNKIQSVATPVDIDASLPQLKDVAVLDPMVNQRFGTYFVSPFAGDALTVSAFADSAVCARVTYGSAILATVGNYAYDVFGLGFRLGFFYEYMYKWRDHVKVLTHSESYATDQIVARTQQQAHTISWDFVYEFENMVEIGFGGLSTVWGHNIPHNRTVFATLSIVF